MAYTNFRISHSGGLLVHKATHHFDIVNWLIGQEPQEVFANGALRFYGSAGTKRGERCCTCPYGGECEYVYQDSRVPWVKAMYFDCESEDGYYRDRCVFAEEIDIYHVTGRKILSGRIDVLFPGGACSL